MVIVGIVAAVIAAFALGVVIHAAVRGRASGESLTEELRRLGFDVFFGFLTSWIGGGIARRIIARRVRA
ncbi:MAG: hypothetical protein JF615_01405 [Asticcacaulis sp.]|nr:hypothetical protein [Asticcacaulis sp.]